MDDRSRELLRTTTTTSLLEGLFNPDDDVVWQAFDLRYRPIITAVARRLGLSSSDAEDVAQETLIQFVRDYRAGRYQRARAASRLDRRHRPSSSDRPASLTWQTQGGRGCDLAGAACRRRTSSRSSGTRSLIGTSSVRRLEELRRTTRTSEKSIRAFEMIVFDRRSVNAVAEDLDMTPHDIYVSRSRITTLREIAERLRNLYEAD